MHTTLEHFFETLETPWVKHLSGEGHACYSPIDGCLLTHVVLHTPQELTKKIDQAVEHAALWRSIPMPVRGRLIGIFGEVIREHKQLLSDIVTLEAGKIISEARGEVQEMIDIAEYAVGLSRQIAGSLFPSELSHHILQERWQPKGVVGIISAFNFPVAVWMWNLALSVVCGNTNIWKPSEKTLVCAIACQALWEKAVERFTSETQITVPDTISTLILGDRDLGEKLVQDKRVSLISATGSCAMGLKVQAEVAKTLGRSCLLELGGNNAVIITPSAPMPLTLESTLFGAMGTAGQRCTTTRRLFIHESKYDLLWTHIEKAYHGLNNDLIGDPRDPKTLIGPLIDKNSFDQMQQALQNVKNEGGHVVGGQRVHTDRYSNGYYVRPAVVKLKQQTTQVLHEVFAPILYVIPYRDLAEAVALNNSVEQGLSSAIFTTDLQEAEYFLSHSDCGIANVNNGTSGAEIGGAFGGNKATGGGRESGSDSWKQYMNRCTIRVNTKPEGLKLAQGVQFPIPLDRDALLKGE